MQVPGGWDLPATAVPGSLRIGDPACLMLRPERIELSTVTPAAGDGLAVKVRKRVFSGEQLRLELETAGGIVLNCTKPSLRNYRQLAPGDSVWLRPTECRALKATVQ